MVTALSRLADRRAWRLAVGGRRRLIAAALAAMSVVLVIVGTRPDPEPTPAPIVVAARDIAAGVVVSGADLRLVSIPPDIVPAGTARSIDEVTGRVLAGAVRRGEPMTDARVLGPGVLTPEQIAAGLVMIPVRIPDASSAALLRAGDTIDILATTNGATTGDDAGTVSVAARAVTVLSVPGVGRNGSGDGGGSGPGGDSGALVLVAGSSTTAGALAAAAVTSRLSIVVEPRPAAP